MNVDELSVVIPTYNGSRFLREALESVYVQTLPPREIIVVDDNSNDDTLSLLDLLAGSSPVPIRIVRLPTNSGGPAGPLNAGIEAASCDWIAVLEQDDAMRVDRLELQAAALATYRQCRFGSARASLLGSQGDTTGFFWGDVDQFRGFVDDATLAARPKYLLAKGSAAFRMLLDQQYLLTNSSYIFSKSLWRDVGGFERSAKSCADLAFALAAAANSDLAIVNAPVIEHRLHPESLNQRDPALTILRAELVRLRYAQRYHELAEDEIQTIYWRLRMRVLGQLWQCGQYRACAQLIMELLRFRLGSQWQA